MKRGRREVISQLLADRKYITRFLESFRIFWLLMAESGFEVSVLYTGKAQNAMSHWVIWGSNLRLNERFKNQYTVQWYHVRVLWWNYWQIGGAGREGGRKRLSASFFKRYISTHFIFISVPSNILLIISAWNITRNRKCNYWIQRCLLYLVGVFGRRYCDILLKGKACYLFFIAFVQYCLQYVA